MKETKQITLCALGIAIVCASTMLIKIPNSIGGYIHPGDAFILLFSAFVNPLFAFLIGGLGSALADLFSGYGTYFFFTLIIKGLQACFVSYMLQRLHKKQVLPSFLIAEGIMVVGYFLADAFLNQSFALSALGLIPNMLQGISGVLIAYFLYPKLKKRVS